MLVGYQLENSVICLGRPYILLCPSDTHLDVEIITIKIKIIIIITINTNS